MAAERAMAPLHISRSPIDLASRIQADLEASEPPGDDDRPGLWERARAAAMLFYLERTGRTVADGRRPSWRRRSLGRGGRVRDRPSRPGAGHHDRGRLAGHDQGDPRPRPHPQRGPGGGHVAEGPLRRPAPGGPGTNRESQVPGAGAVRGAPSRSDLGRSAADVEPALRPLGLQVAGPARLSQRRGAGPVAISSSPPSSTTWGRAPGSGSPAAPRAWPRAPTTTDRRGRPAPSLWFFHGPPGTDRRGGRDRRLDALHGGRVPLHRPRGIRRVLPRRCRPGSDVGRLRRRGGGGDASFLRHALHGAGPDRAPGGRPHQCHGVAHPSPPGPADRDDHLRAPSECGAR